MRRLAALLLLLCLAATPSISWAAHAAPHGMEARAAEDNTYPDQLDAEMHESTAHEVEGKAGLPQFDPSSYPSQIFWLVIAFVTLYVVFSKKTLPMIGTVLQNREQHIQGNLDAAQGMKDRAEAAKQSYEAALKDSQDKTAALLAKIDQDMKQETAAKLEAFQQRAAQQVEATESEIEKARKDAMESIQGVAAEVARLAAEKIVGISTDIDQAKTAVQKIKRAA